jgi:chromosome segregation ATPase
MMTANVVRLGPADFSEMTRRLNSRLTDEGARAWYAHDVSELLREVLLLRQERAEAFDSFNEHLRDQYDDSVPLSDVAQRWRERATGFWEKARIRKMNAEIAEAQAALDALRQVVDETRQLLLDQENRMAEALSNWEDERAALTATNERLTSELASRVEQLAAVGQELLTTRQALSETESDAARRIMAAEVEANSWKAELRVLLAQANEFIS